MRKSLIIVALGVVPLLAIAGFASAGGGQSTLDVVRSATDAYHDFDVATGPGGYNFPLPLLGTTTTCIANGDAGAMGIHMVNGGLVGDGVLNPAAPEVLLYEKRNNGTFKLTGVEYVLPIGPTPPPAGTTPPMLLGQPMNVTDARGFFGEGQPVSYLYTLHVWIWKPNPSGIFTSWNTRVSC